MTCQRNDRNHSPTTCSTHKRKEKEGDEEEFQAQNIINIIHLIKWIWPWKPINTLDPMILINLGHGITKCEPIRSQKNNKIKWQEK